MKVIRQSELTTTQSDLIDTIRDQIKYKHLLEIVSIGAIEVGGHKVLLKDRWNCSDITWFNTIGEASKWTVRDLLGSNVIIRNDMFTKVGQEAIKNLQRSLQEVSQIKTHKGLKNELTAIEKKINDLETVKNEIRKQLNAVCPHEDTYLVDSWDEIRYKCRNCYGYITKEKECSNG
ncbi:hypothetical protein HKK70_08780 [Bacillus safensis]|uniref:hypothetical protein n=1 Tax=Bacillus safensis TaxID=561879 RepID=UPI00146DB864|nr:hypothetical protein [Bacillus safensis]NMW01859.1 hypothetical protein [Bacillus safensis]